jgi:hypothetical protein
MFSCSCPRWLATPQLTPDGKSRSQSQIQCYFTTSGLPPIISSWRQAPLDPRTEIFCSWTLAVIVLTQHPLWQEDGFVSYEYAWPFVKLTYRTYVIEMSLFCTTHKSSVQALQSRLCLSYVSYSTTTAWSPERVVSLTAAKFKPLIFFMSGFALSYLATPPQLVLLI